LDEKTSIINTISVKLVTTITVPLSGILRYVLQISDEIITDYNSASSLLVTEYYTLLLHHNELSLT